MDITEGYLAAWAATARVLEQVEPAELELLPEIAESTTRSPGRIQGMPGAFDFDLATAQTLATTLFPLVLAGMNFAAPKLFETVIDIGKDSVKKLIERRLATKPAATAPSPKAEEVVRLRELIRTAVLERRLALGTADIIANAVIAQLAIDKAN
ncbi:hypothetical protein [Variovorax terrae]|uniref:Uncharacterized protein n=1 Tax=Variovorax terrae TaxID=2923278 RepID=A0A9X1VWJ9_9BURK|nr:hypothetical protein [Variovorax terrae]MCJ0764560.1 hypothetical protein [Variovorax terrae]